MKTALVIGGSGGLGRYVLRHLKKNNITAICLDIQASSDCDHYINIDKNQSLAQQTNKIVKTIAHVSNHVKFSGVICTAGGMVVNVFDFIA